MNDGSATLIVTGETVELRVLPLSGLLQPQRVQLVDQNGAIVDSFGSDSLPPSLLSRYSAIALFIKTLRQKTPRVTSTLPHIGGVGTLMVDEGCFNFSSRCGSAVMVCCRRSVHTYSFFKK